VAIIGVLRFQISGNVNQKKNHQKSQANIRLFEQSVCRIF